MTLFTIIPNFGSFHNKTLLYTLDPLDHQSFIYCLVFSADSKFIKCVCHSTFIYTDMTLPHPYLHIGIPQAPIVHTVSYGWRAVL